MWASQSSSDIHSYTSKVFTTYLRRLLCFFSFSCENSSLFVYLWICNLGQSLVLTNSTFDFRICCYLSVYAIQICTKFHLLRNVRTFLSTSYWPHTHYIFKLVENLILKWIFDPEKVCFTVTTPKSMPLWHVSTSKLKFTNMRMGLIKYCLSDIAFYIRISGKNMCWIISVGQYCII